MMLFVFVAAMLMMVFYSRHAASTAVNPSTHSFNYRKSGLLPRTWTKEQEELIKKYALLYGLEGDAEFDTEELYELGQKLEGYLGSSKVDDIAEEIQTFIAKQQQHDSLASTSMSVSHFIVCLVRKTKLVIKVSYTVLQIDKLKEENGDDETI